MTNSEKLQLLKDDMLNDQSLMQSDLAQTAKQLVFGYGNSSAEVVFVGEAPGGDEDQEGRPFVGKAGTILRQCLTEFKLRFEDFGITNLVKYRPLKNRDPLLPGKRDAYSLI